MAQSELPELNKMAARDFKMVTATKNKLLKGIKASQTVDAKVSYIAENFPEALEEFTSIIFELAGIDEEIQNEVAMNFLGRLDFKAVFEQERIAESHVKEAKLISLIEKVDKSNEQLVEKVDRMSRKTDKNVLANIEKVKLKELGLGRGQIPE